MAEDTFYTAINLINEIVNLGGYKRKLLFDQHLTGVVFVMLQGEEMVDFSFDNIEQLCNQLRQIHNRLLP